MQDDDLSDHLSGKDNNTPELELLLPPEAPATRAEPATPDKGNGGEAQWSLAQDLYEIMEIALPTALGNLSEFLPITFAMTMVGQMRGGGEGLELDALAMANSYFNMTGLALQYGLNSALRTLCPQAVGSGRSRQLSGIYVQRAAILATVALVPSVVLAFNAASVLGALGQPPAVAVLAQAYVVRVLPALAGIAFMTVLQRVLQAEGHILANFYICFVVFLCAPAIQYAAINVLGWGLEGAAIAFSAYNCLYLMLMVPYMLCADMGHVFIPRSEALSASGMYSHLALALPGLACQLLEWASMELISIVAGTRPSAGVLIGAMGMMLNLEAIFAMCWVGFMVAVSIKVGHHIGAGEAHRAKRFSILGTGVACALALAVAGGLYAARGPIVGLYTAHAGIAALSRSLVWACGLLITANALNCTIQGVLTGAGLQRYTATCNLLSWYVVAAPVAAGAIWGLNLDVDAGVVLLLCATLAQLTAFLAQVFLLVRHDWERSVDEASVRMLESSQHDAEAALVHAADPEAGGGGGGGAGQCGSGGTGEREEYARAASSAAEIRVLVVCGDGRLDAPAPPAHAQEHHVCGAAWRLGVPGVVGAFVKFVPPAFLGARDGSDLFRGRWWEHR